MAEEDDSNEKKSVDVAKLAAMSFIVLNLICCGLGVFLVYSNTLGYENPSLANHEFQQELDRFLASIRDEPVMYKMDTLTTNLNGIPRRMVRIELNLEMLDAEGFEEVFSMGPQTRDAIVRVLNGKTYDQLESVQGKLKLKNEIITQVNDFLDQGVVKNVFFSNFAIQ